MAWGTTLPLTHGADAASRRAASELVVGRPAASARSSRMAWCGRAMDLVTRSVRVRQWGAEEAAGES